MIRQFIDGQRQPVWYSLVSVFVSVFLVAVLGVIYVKKTTDRAIRLSEHKQCELVKIIDDFFQKVPPNNPPSNDPQSLARVEYARAVHEQRVAFHCDTHYNK